MQKTADPEARPHVSRVRMNRIQEVHRLMQEGKLTIMAIVAAKKGERGWSYRSVEKLMRCPEWKELQRQFTESEMLLGNVLVSRQLSQIETGELTPGAQLAWRQRIIDTFRPKIFEQKISGELNQKLEVDKPVITVKDLIGEYGDVILDEVMERRLHRDRGDPGEDTGQPVDTKPPTS